MADFFISYNSADEQKAEWIAWTLRDADYAVRFAKWECAAGTDISQWMADALDDCARMICVTTPHYLSKKAKYSALERAAMLWADVDGSERKLVFVKLAECKLPVMFATRSYISFADLGRDAARQQLLDQLRDPTVPEAEPDFGEPWTEIDPGPEPEFAPPAITGWPIFAPLDIGTERQVVGRDDEVKRTKKGVSANETTESSRPMEIKTIKSERFEAIAEVGNAGNLLKYHILEKGDQLSFTDVFELWERDPEFVDFYVSIFKQSGYYGYVWETPAISTASIHQVFEFVIHNIPKSSSLPDHNTFAEYFNTETAPEGIVAFDNLGGDALLVVPSPYRESANYSGLAEFFSEAPISQQRELWRELGRHIKLRLSDQPMWLSVAAGGITWLHLRLDSSPKYYRFQPYTEQR